MVRHSISFAWHYSVRSVNLWAGSRGLEDWLFFDALVQARLWTYWLDSSKSACLAEGQARSCLHPIFESTEIREAANAEPYLSGTWDQILKSWSQSRRSFRPPPLQMVVTIQPLLLDQLLPTTALPSSYSCHPRKVLSRWAASRHSVPSNLEVSSHLE